MSIEEIPSDEIVVMSNFWHRAFNAAGCNPRCHSCRKMIPVNDKFKLATVEKFGYTYDEGNSRKSRLMIPSEISHSKEVMLCDVCTTSDFAINQQKMFTDNRKEYEKAEKEHEKRGGGCFRVNGKIQL